MRKLMFLCIGVFLLIAFGYFMKSGTFNLILLMLLVCPLHLFFHKGHHK